MKRKCPNCGSKETSEVIIFTKDKDGKSGFPSGPTEWVCDACDHMW